MITGAVLWPMLVIGIGNTVVVRCTTFFGARHGREGLTACLVASAILSVIALPATWAINWFTLGVRGRPDFLGANIYAVTVPLSMLGSLLAATLLARGRVGVYWVNEAITAGVTAISVFVLAAVGALSATTFAIGAVIAVAVDVTVMAALQQDIALQRPKVDFGLLKSVLVYVLRVGLTLVPFQLTMRVDQLLVSMSAPMNVLGNYSVAAAWSTILSVIGVGFSTVVLSDSLRIDLNSFEDLELASGRLRRAAVVVLTVGAITCASAPIAIPLLYGSDFGAAIFPAMILSVAAVPLYLNLLLHEFSRGIGVPNVGWLPEAAGLAAALAGLKLLYFRFGTIGASSASLIAYIVVLTLMLYRLSRAVPLLRIRSLIPRADDVKSVWSMAKALARSQLPRRAEAMS
jgi:O-antigen/teichoic acid export membrane protein